MTAAVFVGVIGGKDQWGRHDLPRSRPQLIQLAIVSLVQYSCRPIFLVSTPTKQTSITTVLSLAISDRSASSMDNKDQEKRKSMNTARDDPKISHDEDWKARVTRRPDPAEVDFLKAPLASNR